MQLWRNASASSLRSVRARSKPVIFLFCTFCLYDIVISDRTDPRHQRRVANGRRSTTHAIPRDDTTDSRAVSRICGRTRCQNHTTVLDHSILVSQRIQWGPLLWGTIVDNFIIQLIQADSQLGSNASTWILHLISALITNIGAVPQCHHHLDITLRCK